MVDRVRPDDWTPVVWSHGAVMDMQAKLDPVRMARYADDWQRAVDAIRDVLVELSCRVAAQLDQSWRGRGADAAVDALRRYAGGSHQEVGDPLARLVLGECVERLDAGGENVNR